jgi:predicted nucleotidyltransferase
VRKFLFSKEEKDNLVVKLQSLLQSQNAVQFAYLYGSFLDYLPCHDIDAGIYVQGIKETDMTFYGLELGEQLSQEVSCFVDLRVLNNCSVSFLYNVLKGKLLIDRNPDLQSQVFEITVSRYLDMKPLLLRATREAFGND